MPLHQTNPTEAVAVERQDDEPLLPRASGNAPADRRCLSCGTNFPSLGWHNRLCRRCAKRSELPGI